MDEVCVKDKFTDFGITSFYSLSSDLTVEKTFSYKDQSSFSDRVPDTSGPIEGHSLVR